MARDNDDFRLRPGKIRDQSGERPGGCRVRGVRARPSFTGQIQQAIRRAGDPSRLNGTGKRSGRFNVRGRGAGAAATLKNRSPWSRDGGARTRARRVAVKARVVRLNPQRGATRGRLRQRQGGGRAPALSPTRRRDEGRREGSGLFGRKGYGRRSRVRRTRPRGPVACDDDATVRQAYERLYAHRHIRRIGADVDPDLPCVRRPPTVPAAKGHVVHSNWATGRSQ